MRCEDREEFERLYMPVEDHDNVMVDIQQDLEQLIDELYDECQTVDKNIVHELITCLAEQLDVKIPRIETLKV